MLDIFTAGSRLLTGDDLICRQVDMKQKLLFAVCTRTFVARCKSISCDGSGPEVGKETAWKGKVAKFTSGVVFGFVEFCTKYWISIKPRSATTSPGISASLKIKKPRFICFGTK